MQKTLIRLQVAIWRGAFAIAWFFMNFVTGDRMLALWGLNLEFSAILVSFPV